MQTIEQTIDIAGTPSNILTALTTENGVAGWWTDDCDVTAKQATYRFKRADGERVVTFRVDDVTASSVVMTCTAQQNNPDWIGTKLSFAVSTTGDRTRVALVHAGYPANNECYAQCQRGWTHFMASLKKYIETGVGEPFTKPVPDHAAARCS